MNKPPPWFAVLAVLALLWNLAGLFAVVADLKLSAAEIAALPLDQQALYRARPGWWPVWWPWLAARSAASACCCGGVGRYRLLPPRSSALSSRTSASSW